MLFDLSSQAARSARALSETMVAITIHMADPPIQILQECRSRAQSAYDNVAEVGPGAMRGNVVRFAKRDAVHLAEAPMSENHSFN
jgi:hypothetical protein